MLSIEEINRLEQENKAYKQSEQEAQEIIAELEAKNKELQAKVQRLTYNNHKLDEFFDKAYKENAELKAENEQWKKTTDGLLKIQYTLADSCKKYDMLLQDIKAIAEENIIGCFSDKCDLADEILQKITKAEEE